MTDEGREPEADTGNPAAAEPGTDEGHPLDLDAFLSDDGFDPDAALTALGEDTVTEGEGGEQIDAPEPDDGVQKKYSTHEEAEKGYSELQKLQARQAEELAQTRKTLDETTSVNRKLVETMEKISNSVSNPQKQQQNPDDISAENFHELFMENGPEAVQKVAGKNIDEKVFNVVRGLQQQATRVETIRKSAFDEAKEMLPAHLKEHINDDVLQKASKLLQEESNYRDSITAISNPTYVANIDDDSLKSNYKFIYEQALRNVTADVLAENYNVKVANAVREARNDIINKIRSATVQTPGSAPKQRAMAPGGGDDSDFINELQNINVNI